MQRVEEQPLETIHLYLVREADSSPNPSLLPLVLFTLVLLCLFAIGVALLYQPPEEPVTIRVPAILLPLRTFSTSVAITSTGTKTYPATTAHGTLTLTNGSILSVALPEGMIFSDKDGVEVVTNEAVSVPAGNANSFGRATVSAQVVKSGAQGNIPPLDINQVYGTSLYIRNLQAFTGGKDISSITFITRQDRQNALSQARDALTQQTVAGLLYRPCRENVTGTTKLSVTWICQFVTYEAPHFPGVRVLHALVAGKTILLEVVFVARPRRFETK